MAPFAVVYPPDNAKLTSEEDGDLLYTGHGFAHHDKALESFGQGIGREGEVWSDHRQAVRELWRTLGSVPTDASFLFPPYMIVQPSLLHSFI